MGSYPTEILWIVGAYLLGAVPFGLLIGFARGVDIRTQGSRNIGATNAGRVLGRSWGFLCLGLDLLKGFLPVCLVGLAFGGTFPDVSRQWLWLAIGAASVVGHVFPIYLGFRGGKGVATTIGVGLGIYPYLAVPMAIALLGYAVARFASGFVSLGSLAIGVLFPFAFFGYAWFRGWPLSIVWPFQLVTALLGALILLRHQSNIARMLRGTELHTANSPAGRPENNPDRTP